MKTDQAVERAGGIKPLAEILGITISAVMQWGEEIPQAREWQLRVMRPEWFRAEATPGRAAAGSRALERPKASR